MATNDVYRLSVDYTLATEVVSPVSSKTAFVPKVQFYGGGTPFDVAITSPLGAQAIADSVAVNPATAATWSVVGTAADGAAASGNPVQMAGKDGSSNIQALLTDTGGSLTVVGSIAHDAVDSGNPIKIGAVADTTRTAVAAGDRVDLKADLNGNLFSRMTLGSGAGSDGDSNNLIGTALTNTGATGIKVSTAGWVFNGTSWDRERKANLTSRLVSSAASVNATLVKNSAGDVIKVTGINTNAAARYLKLYNKASAPTVGTDTPVWTEYLAPQTKFDITIPAGLYFSTGIGYGLTTGSADADTGAVGAGDILALNIGYA